MFGRRRPLIGLLTVVVAAGLLAGCTSATPGAPTGVRVETRGPVGPVPAGLDRFYGQPVGWGDCAAYEAPSGATPGTYTGKHMECARVTVPLDYANPNGRTITLALIRRPASQPDRRIGSLLVNPGGPGASGLQAAASLVDRVSGNELGQRFDVVGFDPRGVGASDPDVRCLTDPEHDAERLLDETDASPAGVTRTETDHRDYAQKCAQRTGADMLSHVGTKDVAKDLDVLRSALGDQKLTYLGYSYGTRIGSSYAEQFPNNVRALLLDGAVDPTQNPVDAETAQAAGFQQAFNQFAAWCAPRQDCALGHDPAAATQAFRDLTIPLIRHPMPAGDGRVLSYSDATTAAIQALYTQSLWESLNTGLNELRRGSGRGMMALADVYYERDTSGHYSTTTDAFNAVHCVDDTRITDEAQQRLAQQRYQTAAPFLNSGNPPSPALDYCAYWPVPPTDTPHQPSVAGLPPVLVVSTTRDPATPYQAGVNLANALHGGLLTFEGTQHTVFLQGNGCVDAAGVRYLVDLRLPPPGTRCAR
ncbi:alpha/beta hydrolase [Gandjariella thermophila]|uniref:Alpha/beta hydrolase n=1 Tax=Gandjariella thermophila TaxID=1931992 RepID=A0A4D4JIQ3_9PSEU|nr:alpha/beta hydrolase [Gandjariella thermophila]GDY33767.1 alpha/beta hydrolase [Gandjariella thermophila]